MGCPVYMWGHSAGTICSTSPIDLCGIQVTLAVRPIPDWYEYIPLWVPCPGVRCPGVPTLGAICHGMRCPGFLVLGFLVLGCLVLRCPPLGLSALGGLTLGCLALGCSPLGLSALGCSPLGLSALRSSDVLPLEPNPQRLYASQNSRWAMSFVISVAARNGASCRGTTGTFSQDFSTSDRDEGLEI
ncbi:hypothetical protein GGQ65_004360 [Rhizobium fabae]|uniref:Uncharacterized protein n=1 Tax=Rhizobium fabae TaxID=573179 RepID=A0A7W6B7H2_9HYPH|nr:hypothetical protein [Rhizobium fabae]